VLATEEGGKAVEAGMRQTEIAGSAIQALSLSVNESAQAATQIAASSQQQLVGVDQVAGAMESIRQASAQNVASATQLESTARGLEQLGQRLKQMVERYKV
jgi:methyl-accepting chemotaxis protein